MSTLRTATRFLCRSAPIGLTLTLGFGLAGCTNSPGLRTGGASQSKTFLSVGDKPLPVASGEPGATVVADNDPTAGTIRRNRRGDARISGRVVDAEGHPVPEARVRLADGGVSGGPVIRATTDRSGAFTLHGLRPGTNYTVVAEWDTDAGPLTGRVTARAADTDVRISLNGAEAAAPTRAAAPSRVNRVSDREPIDEDREPADEPGSVRPAGRVNEEDLPPPAAAETVGQAATTPRGRTQVDASQGRSVLTKRPVSAASWGSGARRSEPTPAPAPAVANAATETDPDPDPGPALPAAKEPEPTAAPDASDDDVPNPLPPALERGQVRAGDQAAVTEPDPAPISGEGAPFAPEPPRVAAVDRSTADSPPALNTQSIAQAARPSAAPASLPEEQIETAPGAIVVEPETFAPVVDRDAPRVPTPGATASTLASDPFADLVPAPSVAAAPLPVVEPAPAVKPTQTPRTTTASPTGPKRRPTWGEVVAATKELPPLEGEANRTAKAKTDAGVARRSLVGDPDPRAVPIAAHAEEGPVTPSCNYDRQHRQIVDFCLPDLDGKPLRFQDLDADLVLIDFWGTWCQPCVKAIPHLVDLQARMGKKLVILGVACESDAPNVAAPRVAATAAKLHVNYPIVISRNDGSGPLEEAMQVQAFPTMVLVDRQGRVLWRDQGATPATLARLDRFLDVPPTPDDRVTR